MNESDLLILVVYAPHSYSSACWLLYYVDDVTKFLRATFDYFFYLKKALFGGETFVLLRKCSTLMLLQDSVVERTCSSSTPCCLTVLQVESEMRATIRWEIFAGPSQTACWRRSASQRPIILHCECATPPRFNEILGPCVGVHLSSAINNTIKTNLAAALPPVN